MVDLAEAYVFYKLFICNLLHIDPMKVKIICKTDNSGMHYSTHSLTQILDKCLRIEMAILREMIANKDIYNITWVPSENQVADVFTKRGVPSSKIPSTDLRGHFDNSELLDEDVTTYLRVQYALRTGESRLVVIL